MSRVVQAESLIGVGGFLEAMGVVAVAADVWLVRREVKRHTGRTTTAYLAGRAEGRATAAASLEGGREPTLQERVGVLEKRVGRLQDDLTETVATMREQLRKEMVETAERGQMATQDHVEDLDFLVRRVTTGGTGLRVFGVLLVLGGIVLSVWGSLLRG